MAATNTSSYYSEEAGSIHARVDSNNFYTINITVHHILFLYTVATVDIAFIDKLLDDFRKFCNNEDRGVLGADTHSQVEGQSGCASQWENG